MDDRFLGCLYIQKRILECEAMFFKFELRSVHIRNRLFIDMALSHEAHDFFRIPGADDFALIHQNELCCVRKSRFEMMLSDNRLMGTSAHWPALCGLSGGLLGRHSDADHRLCGVQGPFHPQQDRRALSPRGAAWSRGRHACRHGGCRSANPADLERDRQLTYTSKGIHKDDLRFEMNGNLIKKFGSQGQQKSFLIALKLAQIKRIKEITNKNPILLLDDIFDKLDDNRVSDRKSVV